MKFPVAIQLYSVRDDAAADLDGTLAQIKAMGYDGVEFAGLYGHSPEQVRDLCEKHGLVPVSAHVPIKDMIADTHATFAAYRTIGVRYAVIPHVSGDYCKAEENFPKLVEYAAEFGKIAKEYGLQLGYHNHDFEFTNMIDGKHMLDVLYESVDADLLKTQLDTCWVNVGGENPSEYVRKYAGRCPTVHLKDFVGQKSENMYALIGVKNDADAKAAENQAFELRPVGYGVQDFPSILKASEEAGAQWVIVEQDRPSLDKTALECAKLSIDYLKTINL